MTGWLWDHFLGCPNGDGRGDWAYDGKAHAYTDDDVGKRACARFAGLTLGDKRPERMRPYPPEAPCCPECWAVAGASFSAP